MPPKKPLKRLRVTKKDVAKARATLKDPTPKWDDAINWPIEEFNRKFRHALQYYTNTYSFSELKPYVEKWMKQNEYSTEVTKLFHNSHDWRTSPTTGAIAACLLQGMPSQRDDFNNGKDCVEWLKKDIEVILKHAAEDTNKTPVQKISIQDRIQEQVPEMVSGIEQAIEDWQTNPGKFVYSNYNPLLLLNEKQTKSPHAREIKKMYAFLYNDLEELTNPDPDPDLIEAYKHRTKRQVLNLKEFLRQTLLACDVIIDQSKVEKKPRKVKEPNKTQKVSKLQYKSVDDQLKLVSVNPLSVIDSKELWVYNTKLRKLGCYVAQQDSKLDVKGTTILNFDPEKSVQKGLRKPAVDIEAFRNATKSVFRKKFADLSGIETKLKGRMNSETVLLKVFN